MKVKSIGFAITNNNKNIDTGDVFEYLIRSSNEVFSMVDYSRQVLICDDEDFYIGLVLTFRNQKKNCKSSIKDGKFVVKVDDLQGDEKLVNFNFMCIKKKSLKGLYMSYHGSCPISNLFSHLQTKSNQYIRSIADSEIKLLGDKPKQKDIKKVNEKYNERIDFSIIADKKSIETIISNFRKVKSATFRFSSLDFKQGSMTAVSPYTKNTDIIFNIAPPEREKTSPIARKLNEVYKSLDNIIKARVIATDHFNNDRVIDFFNCPAFFDEYDFDTLAEMVDGLTNENFKSNPIVAIIKEQIIDGKNKNEFN